MKSPEPAFLNVGKKQYGEHVSIENLKNPLRTRNKDRMDIPQLPLDTVQEILNSAGKLSLLAHSIIIYT
jgi:hypothetical protein